MFLALVFAPLAQDDGGIWKKNADGAQERVGSRTCCRPAHGPNGSHHGSHAPSLSLTHPRLCRHRRHLVPDQPLEPPAPQRGGRSRTRQAGRHPSPCHPQVVRTHFRPLPYSIIVRPNRAVPHGTARASRLAQVLRGADGQPADAAVRQLPLRKEPRRHDGGRRAQEAHHGQTERGRACHPRRVPIQTGESNAAWACVPCTAHASFCGAAVRPATPRRVYEGV